MKNKHNQSVGSVVERSDDRIKETGEVFTPMELVYEMIDEIPKRIMTDPESTFLDNSCGSGNFLVGLKKVLMEEYGYSEEHVLNNMLFGVDLMEDNVKETCKNLGVEYGHRNFVAHDALTYDYSFGRPIGLELFFE